MKRFFILATAAIVALASCAKTEVVYNDAPEQIAFKQITNVMTKADLSGSMGVYAYYNGASYFGKTEFAQQTGETYWTAADPKYWPVSGDVGFVMYAPFNATVESTSIGNLTFTKSVGDNDDLLYGTVTSPKTSNAVTVTLNHALTNVLVNVKGDPSVTLVSVELLEVGDAGTGAVDFSNSEVIWTPTAVKSPVIYNTEQALSPTPISCTSCLVLPAEQLDAQQIKLTYKVAGSVGTLTYTTADGVGTNVLGTAWESGKKYIYNINVGVDEIMFDADVADWTAGNGVDGEDL